MKLKTYISRMARAGIRILPQLPARSVLFFHRFGYLPNLQRPRTFQEKLNYRILFDRRELLVTSSSKVRSKELVADLGIRSLHIPETYWHGSDLKELEKFRAPGPWVLKPSHRSGTVLTGPAGYIPVKHQSTQLKKLLREREYRTNKLWAYRHVERELIIEERLGGSGGLIDYKFFVFEGRIALIQVDSDRFGTHVRTLYDAEYEMVDASYGVSKGNDLISPALLRSLGDIASQVGQLFDFIRVDLYHYNGQTYFGELTVYPGGGLSPWPYDLDLEIGKHWKSVQASKTHG